MSLCDLHAHSTFSDGTCTPEELVTLGLEAGLCALALCDHNNVEGLPRFLAVAEGTALKAVPAVELSTDYTPPGEPTRELHIVGLFIQPEHYAAVEERTIAYLQSKEESNLALTEALNKAGYAIDYERVKARTTGIPNRAHFAMELIESGYISSIREGCLTILSPHNGIYTSPLRATAFETIAFLKSIDAAAVLAHPFLNLKEDDLRIFLWEAKAYGLDGMETLYSTFDETLTAKAIAIASEFGLKQSGGSDFHGSNKPDISMGIGRGNLAIPLEFLRQLENR